VAVRDIRVYPDPVLKQVASPVASVDEPARELAADLVDTMRAHERCVGLAANQVGELVRLVVVDVTGHPKARSCHGTVVLFDPVIVASSGSQTGREGCLSVPELTGDVRRAASVVVQGRDERDRLRVIEADAFEARALQHEIDHLDGILFLDRVANPLTDLFRRRR
jgi:peptide deformylase